MKRKGPSKWCWLAPGKFPVYSEAPNTEDDILYPDSDDDYNDPTQRRLRLEAQGQRYLQGKPVFLLSASLRGPCTRESGWTNPWSFSQRTRTRGEIRDIEDKEENIDSPSPLLDTPMHDFADEYKERRLYSHTSTKAVAAESQSVRLSFASSNPVPTVDRTQAPPTASSSFLDRESAARVENWREEVQPAAVSRDEFWSSEGSLKRSAAATWLRKQNENKNTKRRRIQESDEVSSDSPTPAMRHASEQPNASAVANSFSSVAESLEGPKAAIVGVPRKKAAKAGKCARNCTNSISATGTHPPSVTSSMPARKDLDERAGIGLSQDPSGPFQPPVSSRSDDLLLLGERSPEAVQIWKRYKEEIVTSEAYPREARGQEKLAFIKREVEFEPVISFQSQVDESFHFRSKVPRRRVQPATITNETTSEDAGPTAESSTDCLPGGVSEEGMEREVPAVTHEREIHNLDNTSFRSKSDSAQEQQRQLEHEDNPKEISGRPGSCIEGPTLIASMPSTRSGPNETTSDENLLKAVSSTKQPECMFQMELAVSSNALFTEAPSGDKDVQRDERAPAHLLQLEPEAIDMDESTMVSFPDDVSEQSEQPLMRLSQLKPGAAGYDTPNLTFVPAQGEASGQPPNNGSRLDWPTFNPSHEAPAIPGHGYFAKRLNLAGLTPKPSNIPTEEIEDINTDDGQQHGAAYGTALQDSVAGVSRPQQEDDVRGDPESRPLAHGEENSNSENVPVIINQTTTSLQLSQGQQSRLAEGDKAPPPSKDVTSEQPSVMSVRSILDTSSRNTINGLPRSRPLNSPLSSQTKAQSPWVKDAIDVPRTFNPTAVEESRAAQDDRFRLSFIASQVLATFEVPRPLLEDQEPRHASQPLPHITRPFNPMSSPVSESGLREIGMSAFPELPACSAPELRKSTPPSQLMFPSTPETKQSSLPTPDLSISMKSFNPNESPTPLRHSSKILPISLGDGRLPSTQVLMDAHLSNPWLRPTTHKPVSSGSKKTKRVSWAPLPGEDGHDDTPRRSRDLSFRTPTQVRAASPPPDFITKSEASAADQKFSKHFAIVASRRFNKPGYLRPQEAEPLLPSASQQVCPSPAPDAMAEAFVLADTVVVKGKDAADGMHEDVHDDGESEASEVSESKADGQQSLLDVVHDEGEDDVSAVLDNLGDFLNYADVDTELSKMSIAKGKENRKPSAYGGGRYLDLGMLDAGVWD